MGKPELTLEQQQQLIAALRARAPFPEPCTSVELIETHISWVLLCGAYAYKIKKALNLGFLDFSTLAKRKQYCGEELRLNRRLAPQLYLDVVAFSGSLDDPHIEDRANPIEYAVKMARFKQSELLDRALREGRVDAVLIDRLAALVADFHCRQSSAPPSPELGTPQAVHAPVKENFATLRSAVQDAQMRQSIATVETWSNSQYDLLHENFARRRREGFVRECHGDMHLGNMALHDGKLLVFDGIEFNPSLYWIDVISEAAFLFMDLDDHGRTDYAWRFLNAYLAHTGDYGGVRLLPYYLCYRAMVRAKVAAIRVTQSADESSCDELHAYLGLAERYCRQRVPTLLISHGVSGSGKSTVCTPLAERIGALHLRSDRERQRIFGRADHDGAARVYSAAANEQTYARLHEYADCALAAGISVIVDATFLDPAQRAHFAALANAHHGRFRILHFQAEPERLRERVRQRTRRARDISEADQTVLAHQLAGYTPLSDAEQAMVWEVDTESADVTELVDGLAQRIRDWEAQAASGG